MIDGFVEGVDVKGIPEKQRALVQARLASLIGERHVTLGEIERRLLLASDIPGLVAEFDDHARDGPGRNAAGAGGDLERGRRHARVDNRLPDSLGTWELNGALAVNSPLGYGEQIYGAASTGYNLGKVFDATTPMQLLGAGFVLPVGVDGLKINPEYTNSVTRPAPTPWAPADVGYYQRFDLRASYPLILSPRPGADGSGDLRMGAGASDRRSGSTRISMTTSTTSPGSNSRITSGCPTACWPRPSCFPGARRARRNAGRSDRGSALAAGGVPDLQQTRARRDLDASLCLTNCRAR